MARPVYSTLFVAERLTTAGPPVGFIPVSGQVAVIRDIELLNTGGLAGDELVLELGPDGGEIMSWDVLAPGTFAKQWVGRVVVPFGNFFQFVSNAGSWHIACSGYVLTNP